MSSKKITKKTTGQKNIKKENESEEIDMKFINNFLCDYAEKNPEFAEQLFGIIDGKVDSKDIIGAKLSDLDDMISDPEVQETIKQFKDESDPSNDIDFILCKTSLDSLKTVNA